MLLVGYSMFWKNWRDESKNEDFDTMTQFSSRPITTYVYFSLASNKLTTVPSLRLPVEVLITSDFWYMPTLNIRPSLLTVLKGGCERFGKLNRSHVVLGRVQGLVGVQVEDEFAVGFGVDDCQ